MQTIFRILCSLTAFICLFTSIQFNGERLFFFISPPAASGFSYTYEDPSWNAQIIIEEIDHTQNKYDADTISLK